MTTRMNLIMTSTQSCRWFQNKITLEILNAATDADLKKYRKDKSLNELKFYQSSDFENKWVRERIMKC
jgi:hypothetical protein